jgi:hypothetical protein
MSQRYINLAGVAAELFPDRELAAGVAAVRRLIREGQQVRGTGQALKLKATVLPGGTFVEREELSRFLRDFQEWNQRCGVGRGRRRTAPAAPAAAVKRAELRLVGMPATPATGRGFVRCAPSELGRRIDVCG